MAETPARRNRGLELSLPLALAAALVAADQVTKAIVVAKIPEGRVALSLLGDFFWLVHARNLGIAFSLGDTFPETFRRILFIALPLILIVAAMVYYFRSRTITVIQRWFLAILVAGGLGNLIDRAFKPEGVVDFLSFAFYGILGMQRFPTFNVADMCIFFGAVLLAVTGFLSESPGAAGKGAAGSPKQ